MTVVTVHQSPMNAQRWCLELECGHEVWVTAKRRPKRSTYPCAAIHQAVRATVTIGKTRIELPEPGITLGEELERRTEKRVREALARKFEAEAEKADAEVGRIRAMRQPGRPMDYIMFESEASGAADAYRRCVRLARRGKLAVKP